MKKVAKLSIKYLYLKQTIILFV